MHQKSLLIAVNSDQATEVATALNFQLPPGEAPEWIELIPAHTQILGRDGRKWLNDRPNGVIEAFNTDARDIVIDVEHSTEIKAPKGEPAPARGWINQLELREGAVWGRIDWTDAGKQTVVNRDYRYYSPAFLYEKETGRIVKILSVGLTNRSNLRLKALNHTQTNQEDTMLKKLLKALGLAEDATEAQALNAVTQMQTDLATALNRAETPDLAKFVPRADYDQVLARATNAEQKLTDLQTESLEKEIEAEVGAALKSGKITPATKDYYTAMCRQENGLEAFKKFAAAAPVIGDPSKLDEKKPETQTALNTDQLKIAQMFGNSAEDIAQYGK